MSESNPDRELYKFITTPEADHLGELYLVQADLDAAYDTLALYFSKHAFDGSPRSREETIISSSLFRDGILLYCACFSAKDADKLDPKAVYGHLEGWEEECQRLLDIRDPFVAHNFGPQRQHNVIAVCKKVRRKIFPVGLTQFFTRFAGWAPEEGNTLLPFIEIARKHLTGRIAEAEIPVVRYLENITPKQLANLKDANVSIPRVSDYRSSRASFRKNGRGDRLSP